MREATKSDRTKQVQFRMPTALHNQLRKLLIDENISMADLFNNFDTSKCITEEERKTCLKVLRAIKDELNKEYLDALMKRDCELADTKLWYMNNIICADLIVDTYW